MINIKLEEANSLKIQMQMEGDVQGKAAMRFSVISEGVRYSFDAKQVEEGVYEFEFPKMEGKINEGTYDAEIEIIVDGKHFVPLTETVKFTKEIKPTVKLEETSAKPVTGAVKVTLGEVMKKTELPVVENVKRLLVACKTGNASDLNTAIMIEGLSKLAQQSKGKVADRFLVVPKAALQESEILAALKLLEAHGSDLNGIPEGVRELMALSEKTYDACRAMLVEKGVSGRALRDAGL